MQFRLGFFIFLPVIKQKIKKEKNNADIFGIYIFAAVINQKKFFMKKLMYLLVAALVVTFTACGGKEGDTTEGGAADTTKTGTSEQKTDESPESTDTVQK